MATSKGAKPDPAQAEETQNVIEKKYAFIKKKILLHYDKGCKILLIAKITVAVLFLLFTLLAIVLGNRSGQKLEWLTAWILLIFFNVGIFTLADYAKYLMRSKVIPYLLDDSRVEFGEYDIFLEDIDGEEEEEA